MENRSPEGLDSAESVLTEESSNRIADSSLENSTMVVCQNSEDDKEERSLNDASAIESNPECLSTHVNQSLTTNETEPTVQNNLSENNETGISENDDGIVAPSTTSEAERDSTSERACETNSLSLTVIDETKSIDNCTSDISIDSKKNVPSNSSEALSDLRADSDDNCRTDEQNVCETFTNEISNSAVDNNVEGEGADLIVDPLRETSSTEHAEGKDKGEAEIQSPVGLESAVEESPIQREGDLENEVSNDDNQVTVDRVEVGETSESSVPPEPMEVDADIQQDCNEKNKPTTSCQLSEKGVAGSEVDSCIIPDTMDANSAVNINENKKSSKKFDITPVRLEKLMDPQKLIGKISDTPDEKNVLNCGRPQRQAARKAETQIKEIVALADAEGEPESDDNVCTTVCTRCCLLRSCKWIPSLSGNYCLESCYKVMAEQKLCTAKTTLPITNSTVRILPTTMKFQTVSIRVPQSRKAISMPINPLRRCAQCEQHISVEEKALSWEAMEFCNDDCLNRYQKKNGSFCQFSHCEKPVPHTSMGKYAVRFGLEARQFCSGTCLEEFKKILKSCGYCQKDVTKTDNAIRITTDDKHTMKEFCSISCKKMFDCLTLKQPFPEIEDECTVCTTKNVVEFQVVIDGKTQPLCSEVCFNAFKFANSINETDRCHICKKYFEANGPDSVFVFHEDNAFKFCSKICTNVFILFKRKIVPCSWCKVKKYNFDMIKKTSNNLTAYLCSINCLTLYHVSINATSFRKIKCDFCTIISNAQYHLTMSDATIRNFCSYNCVMNFQTQYSKSNMLNTSDTGKSSIITTTPVPLGEPKKVLATPVISTKTLNNTNVVTVSKPKVAIANGFLPQITGASGTTLKVATPITMVSTTATSLTPVITSSSSVLTQKHTKYVQQVIMKPPEPKDIANKTTQCKPLGTSKSVMCKPTVESAETQTEECFKYPAIVPIPVPIYVPVPVMYKSPYPVPVPFPLPIPVPIFIPTTQKTFKGLTAKMKEILDKTPSNPYEADLLLMAKMVAGEERTEGEVTTNESQDENTPLQDTDGVTDDTDALPDVESSTTNKFDEDSLKALTDVSKEISNSRSVDLEAELTSNTITPPVKTEKAASAAEPDPEMDRPRTRKRVQAQQKALAEAPPIKTRRRQSQQQQSQQQESSKEPESKTNGPVVKKSLQVDSSNSKANDVDRPDAGMCLKYTIGIRGWKQWIIHKNEQIEQAAKAANKKAKTFNPNILKLTTDELNYLLCRFVKEIRKPNGTEYAPDTIYYLCLSIQQYLSENGRVDNIFTDPMYEQFTDALDEVAVKFSEINESTQYILTRVEEEHLWESKQLGAYSPHVLLATLMFFNTKYFNLATIEEHMHLSFSHIMKHWKRGANVSSKPGSPGSNRNVLLRFYSPQTALDAPNSRKKKLYEQHENDADQLRCPVRLYEFYLSKCPDSVKQRNDVFYLQPERSCVPDSPVWYSTMPLQKDVLKKILHRILMVKEVNMSLLAS